jgi:S-adenosylmethionine/arginine decarboxylase-like enzyme
VIDRKLTLKATGILEPERVVQAVLQALLEVGLDPQGEHEHRWQPRGLTWCGWGKDFRLVVHTWPEHRLATIDLWTVRAKGEPLIRALELALGWRRNEDAELSRGSPGRARTAPCGDA